MTLIRFNAFVQEMDRQRYYSPRKFTAGHRDFLYEMSDRQYLKNMNAVLTGGHLEELDDEALETVLEKCRRLSDGFGLCVDIPKGARIADMSGLKNMIPQKYYERAQNSISNMPEKQRQEVMEFIGKLYKENRNPQKTMQEHHWIEQSRIRNTGKYPFLSCPPMKEDLLKSKTNLSLIVGHNGGHKNTYNRLLDEKLSRLKGILEDLCIENNVKMNELVNDKTIINMISSQVSKIIGEMQDVVKKDHAIMNNVKKMFVLD